MHGRDGVNNGRHARCLKPGDKSDSSIKKTVVFYNFGHPITFVQAARGTPARLRPKIPGTLSLIKVTGTGTVTQDGRRVEAPGPSAKWPAATFLKACLPHAHAPSRFTRDQRRSKITPAKF